MKLESAIAIILSQQIRQETLSGTALGMHTQAVDIVHRHADQFLCPNRGYVGSPGTPNGHAGGIGGTGVTGDPDEHG